MTYVSTEFVAASRLAAFPYMPVAASAVLIRDERAGDRAARETMLDSAIGAGRLGKTSEFLRTGRLPAAGLSLSAVDRGALVGTVRLWHVMAGADCPALLLGPLAVAASHRSQGLGARLIGEALFRAVALGHKAVILVGDAKYYQRFGFLSGLTAGLDLPGPVDRERFLGLELQPGALRRARGLVSATGEVVPETRLAA